MHEKQLQGSELTIKLLQNGTKTIPCWVSNSYDQVARDLASVKFINSYDSSRIHNHPFGDIDGVSWNCAVPLDPATGLEMTEDTILY